MAPNADNDALYACVNPFAPLYQASRKVSITRPKA